MSYTRRDLAKMAAAALPIGALMAKPNSKWGGVQVGINAPYSFQRMPGSADDILHYMDQLDLSAVELRSQPVEAFLGAPPPAPAAGRTPTPEQTGARTAALEAMRKWRVSASLDQFKTFRKKYEDAGVLIQIVKFDGINNFSDDETDYCFQMARTLGAKAISCEIPLSQTKRLGAFAEKHKMMVGYHGHTNITSPEAFGKPESWETAFTYSKYNGANIDLGHFTAANNVSPAAFLEKYTDRITHVHLKDRKLSNGPNVPWGQGDTPITDILQLMKKRKYTFQATIEFEYPVPTGSDVLTEIGKCVKYCKNALA